MKQRSAGFTLVEVLVALLAMALLTALAWFALDGVLRARDASRETIDATSRLSTVLTQWEQDLRALQDTEIVPPLAFDGQTLRLTRRVEGGIELVAWAVRSGRWQRWAGPAWQRAADLQQGWLQSQQLQGGEPAQVLLADGVTQWQIYFNRGGAWVNPQSTGNLVAAPVAQAPASAASPPAGGASAPAAPVVLRDTLPDAVRLVISFGDRTLTRDIALGPS